MEGVHTPQCADEDHKDERESNIRHETLIHYYSMYRKKMWKLFLCLIFITGVYSEKALVSVYGDYGVGAGGTNLWKYPATIRVNGKSVQVFPAAIHSSLVSSYKYKVLKIRHKSKKGYVHIVDECARGDCRSNHKDARKKNAVLIDIHQSAIKRLGLSWTLQDARFQTVGRVRLNKLPRGIVAHGASKGYLPKKWK